MPFLDTLSSPNPTGKILTAESLPSHLSRLIAAYYDKEISSINEKKVETKQKMLANATENQ